MLRRGCCTKNSTEIHDIAEIALSEDSIGYWGATVKTTFPRGCAVSVGKFPHLNAGYFPECNPFIPLWHHAEGSYVPAAKSIPVRLRQE